VGVTNQEVVKWWNARYPTDQIDLGDTKRIEIARIEMLKYIAVKMDKWNDNNRL